MSTEPTQKVCMRINLKKILILVSCLVFLNIITVIYCYHTPEFDLASVQTTNTTPLSLPTSHLKHPVTLVSAFYKIEKSKHSDEEYQSWLSNFVGQVEGPIVFFGNKAGVEIARRAQGKNTTMMIVTKVMWSYYHVFPSSSEVCRKLTILRWIETKKIFGSTNTR